MKSFYGYKIMDCTYKNYMKKALKTQSHFMSAVYAIISKEFNFFF